MRLLMACASNKGSWSGRGLARGADFSYPKQVVNPPMAGKCLECGSKLLFTVSEGSVVKYLEPAISLSTKYNLPAYLKQTLELTKNRVEGVFGKDKDRQEGLGKWFG